MKKLVALAIVVVVAMSGGHLFAQLSKESIAMNGTLPTEPIS